MATRLNDNLYVDIAETDGVFIDGKRATLRIKGEGGEGRVYSVLGQNEIVVKIYFTSHFNDKSLEKLKILTSIKGTPPSLALPRSLAYIDLGGRLTPVGFTMKAARGKMIEEVLSDGGEHITRPEVVSLLIKIAEAVDALYHVTGHRLLLGDVSDRNIMFDAKGDVTLVDMDSIQADSFPCPVGTDGYISKDIIEEKERGASGNTFRLRERRHDNFALSVLFFRALMGNIHPYAHIGGGSPIENVKEGVFPYDPSGVLRKNAPQIEGLQYLWSALSPELRRAFSETFEDQLHAPVDASDWKALLEDYEDAIGDMIDSGESGYLKIKGLDRHLSGSGFSIVKCYGCHKSFNEKKIKGHLCESCRAKRVVYQYRTCLSPACRHPERPFPYSSEDRKSAKSPFFCPDCERSSEVREVPGARCSSCGSRIYKRNLLPKDDADLCPSCEAKARRLMEKSVAGIRAFSNSAFSEDSTSISTENLLRAYEALVNDIKEALAPYKGSQIVSSYIEELDEELMTTFLSKGALDALKSAIEPRDVNEIHTKALLEKSRSVAEDLISSINDGRWDVRTEKGLYLFSSSPLAFRMRDVLRERLERLSDRVALTCKHCGSERVVSQKEAKAISKGGEYICNNCLRLVDYICPLCGAEHEKIPYYLFRLAESEKKLCASCEKKREELLSAYKTYIKEMEKGSIIALDSTAFDERKERLSKLYGEVYRLSQKFNEKNISPLPSSFFSSIKIVYAEKNALLPVRESLKRAEDAFSKKGVAPRDALSELISLRPFLERGTIRAEGEEIPFSAFPLEKSAIRELDRLVKELGEYLEREEKRLKKCVSDAMALMRGVHDEPSLISLDLKARTARYKRLEAENLDALSEFKGEADADSAIRKLEYYEKVVEAEERELQEHLKSLKRLSEKLYGLGDAKEIERDLNEITRLENELLSLQIRLEDGSILTGTEVPLQKRIREELSLTRGRIKDAEGYLLRGRNLSDEIKMKFEDREVQDWRLGDVDDYYRVIKHLPVDPKAKRPIEKRLEKIERAKRYYDSSNDVFRRHLIALRTDTTTVRDTKEVKRSRQMARAVRHRFKSDLNKSLIEIRREYKAIDANTKMVSREARRALSQDLHPIMKGLISYTFVALLFIYTFTLGVVMGWVMKIPLIIVSLLGLINLVISAFRSERMKKRAISINVTTLILAGLFTFIRAGNEVASLAAPLLTPWFYLLAAAGAVVILCSRIHRMEGNAKASLKKHWKIHMKFVLGKKVKR